MSAFEPIKFSLKTAEIELSTFKVWFAGVTFVGETAIVQEIKKRPHMACLLASLLGMQAPDLIRFELSLKGMFRTDLVLGNDGQRTFGLIEFEDAMSNSIFKGGTAQYRSWSPRIEHGFSQVIDWAWVRSDHPNDSVLTSGFGGPIETTAYAVICGRDASLRDDVERKRFAHRRSNLKVEGHPVLVLTYDQMVVSMENSLAASLSYI